MKIKIIYSVLALALFIYSCNTDSTPPANARLQVRLTDAPGDFQEVNIDIQEVQVHTQSGDPASGWQSLNINKGVYNLLKLVNGLDTLLGQIELPPGRISQLRLVLGNNNSIKVGDQVIPINIPSGQTSGLKVQVNTDLQAGVTYEILLDFDAARSIVAMGNGKFNLKPVIRSIVEVVTGSIKGVVNPPASMPAVYAMSGVDTVATTFTDSTGKFLIKALLPGTYRLVFDPKDGYQPAEKSDVNVVIGNVTDIGVITIN